MVQSSITAWLKKPASVKNADVAVESNVLVPVAPVTPQEHSPPTSDPTLAEVASAPSASPEDNALSKTFAMKPLLDNVELVPLTEDLIPSFKRLNAILLPVAYPTQFYTETMTEPHHSLTLMAVWRSAPIDTNPSSDTEKPRLIGAIRCRILPSDNLYISTIGILSPYRSYGIASHLLQIMVAKASKEYGVRCITAHVWEANDEGLEWYKKRGFEIIGKEPGYYRKLKPQGAVLVRRWIGVGDLLGIAGQMSGTSK
jgi:ribosomal protein S18 acetylase RimI-like enzyme